MIIAESITTIVYLKEKNVKIEVAEPIKETGVWRKTQNLVLTGVWGVRR